MSYKFIIMSWYISEKLFCFKTYIEIPGRTGNSISNFLASGEDKWERKFMLVTYLTLAMIKV